LSGYRRKDLVKYEPRGRAPRVGAGVARSRWPRVGIIGAGRAGVALAVALRRSRVPVLGVHGRRSRDAPPGIVLTAGPRAPWLAEAEVVLLAVGDGAIAPLVADLAAVGLRAGAVVLHLSGALSSDVLAPLSEAGAAVGSMHPLMTVAAEPERAARHFRGAAFVLEGEFEAVRVADRLVRALGGVPLMIAPEAKAVYHAGAVFASNYLVAVLEAAERCLERAGMSRQTAREALLPLARATLENVAAVGPEAALTGPLARGDADTVRAHRSALKPDDRRLYDALAQATLALAKAKGLSRAAEAALRAALGEGPGS